MTDRWVTLDVAMAALQLNRSRTYELAQTEQWAKLKTRPTQYSWADIRRTYWRRSVPESRHAETLDSPIHENARG